MKKSHITRSATAALAITAMSLAMAQTVQSELHRDAATRNVGGDAFMTQYARAFYCNLPDDNNAIVIAARAWNNTTGENNNQYRIPVTQIFDDVWFVGNHYVGQYMIKTADGFVQVDSGNTPSEFQMFNYPALQSLGLSPGYPLKAIFLTHGHGDHDGGAKWALDNLGAQSYIGSADAAGKPYNPILIDSTNLAMRQMTIGGKTFWVMPTPGHTPGSTSAVLEVKDWGQTRRVLINGGQSMTSSIPQVAQYLDSIERTYAMATVLNVEGVMTPHIYWDGEGAKLDEINATFRTNPGQHVYGHENVLRQLAVARECSASWLARLDTTTVQPVWRFNDLDFVDVKPVLTKVAARLLNGWGPLAGQKVTFTVADSGATCTAQTGADGVATCSVRQLLRRTDRVKASYTGAQSADFVDLPADATTQVCRGRSCDAQ
jgi:glyoxylase-like metal-dependent hydrolase (beta-lactamase superfamily II)